MKKKIIDCWTKNQHNLKIFLGCFFFYFLIGLVITYYLNPINDWNFIYGFDIPRVFGDLTIRNFDHYRAVVHPLFIIIFQPLTYILNIIIRNPIITVLLLEATISSISVVILNMIIKKISSNKNVQILLTGLFIFNFGQIVFSSNIETYIFAQVFLLLLWLFTIFKMDQKLTKIDYLLLVLLGIGSIAITITNFIQFIIVLFFLIFLNKEQDKKIFTTGSILASVVIISFVLALIQKFIWPTAPHFILKNLKDLLYGSSEEATYVNLKISFNNILNVIRAGFGHSFNIIAYFAHKKDLGIYSYDNIISLVIYSILFIGFILLNGYFIYKTRDKKENHKIYYAMLITLLFNLLFHVVYGNDTSFLYICHYNFLIILLLGYIINYFNILNSQNITKIFLMGYIILAFRNVYLLIRELFAYYPGITYFQKLPIIILIFALFIIIFLNIKNNFLKVTLMTLSIIFGIVSYRLINTHISYSEFSEYDSYLNKLNLYEEQLTNLKNEYKIDYYLEHDEPLNIFFFGLANHQKLLYKEGKLIDIKTKKIIREFDYTEELIIPNEYTVILKDANNNVYKIYENAKGIYYTVGSRTIELDSAANKINLPDFKDNKYSEILKVLHQEVLFNIDGSTPKPNIIAYNDAWYRDALLVTKVLEQTKNVDLLLPWVNSIDKIYDGQRKTNQKEIDNLGELLYVVGVINPERLDLIDKIVKEINNLKNEDNYLEGIIDSVKQSYYPTVLAMHGASKLGIDLGLKIPKNDDFYAPLTWYYKDHIKTDREEKTNLWPYLNWAYYHYNNKGNLYMLDEIYPLTYEAYDPSGQNPIENECFISEFYCQNNTYISHIWHASEMFLLLND